jgi:DNA helicase-2/ATP-dependent DNA helicase PcrA
VTFANRLTEESGFVEPLQSQGELGTVPRTISFATIQDECSSVAAAIKTRLDQGVHASEIAVLYRVNGQSEAIENALAQAGIDYQVRGGERFFNRVEIKAAIRAIRAEALTPSDKPLFQIVSEICRSLGWQTQAPTEPGLLREKWETLNSLLAITDELPPEATAAEFAAELEERQRSQHEPVKAAVTLSTIHAAKGLEWQIVHMIGLTEGYLPISYAQTEAEVREEKRLMYVGITRAKREITLTWAKRDSTSTRDREPSRFFNQLLARG